MNTDLGEGDEVLPIDFDHSQQIGGVESVILEPPTNPIDSSLIQSQVEFPRNEQIPEVKFTITSKVESFLIDRNQSVVYMICIEESQATVYRSYRHFEWLADTLRSENPGIIVPAIPPKSFEAKLQLYQMKTELIRDDRLHGLIEFLRKVLQHYLLARNPHVKHFLTLPLNELNELYLQKSSIASQIGSSILGRVGSIFSIAGKMFGSSEVRVYQERRKRFPVEQSNTQVFQQLESLLQQEKKKLKEISERLHTIVQSKIQQANQLSILNMHISEWGDCESEWVLVAISRQQTIQHRYYNDIENDIIYPLEYWSKDLELACQGLTERINVGQLVNDLALRLNNEKELNSEQVRLLEEEYDKKSEHLNKLSTNLNQDIPWFTNKLNCEVKELIRQFYEQQRQMEEEISNVWKQTHG